MKTALLKAAERDNSVVVRTSAVQALGRFGDPTILTRLQKIAETDGAEEVKVVAATSVMEIIRREGGPIKLTAGGPTTAKTTNPDATYTIMEFPVRKEVRLDLTPVNVVGPKGVAKVLRDDDGTRIKVYFSDLP